MASAAQARIRTAATSYAFTPTARWVELFGRRPEHGHRGRRYDPRMITAPTAVTAVPTQADPFAGLTETDASRSAAAMTAALADSTRTAYGHAWGGWERWCSTRSLTPLPASAGRRR